MDSLSQYCFGAENRNCQQQGHFGPSYGSIMLEFKIMEQNVGFEPT